jgi:hypothetical protein
VNYSHVAFHSGSPLTSLGRRTLFDAPPDSPVCQARVGVGCTLPTLLQFKSSFLGAVSSTQITTLVLKNNSLSLETYLVLSFTLLTHLAHKNSLIMCWTPNHQNTYRNGPRAHFHFSPFLVIYGNTSKSNTRSCNINANEDQFPFYLRFGIFGSHFATTWFVFANQILFPISKSNTLVWANQEIFQE